MTTTTPRAQTEIAPQRVVGFLGTIVLASWAAYQAAWHTDAIKEVTGEMPLLLLVALIIGGVILLVKWPWSETARSWTLVVLLFASILFGGDQVKEIFGDAPWIVLVVPLAFWSLWELTVRGRWPWEAFARQS